MVQAYARYQEGKFPNIEEARVVDNLPRAASHSTCWLAGPRPRQLWKEHVHEVYIVLETRNFNSDTIMEQVLDGFSGSYSLAIGDEETPWNTKCIVK